MKFEFVEENGRTEIYTTCEMHIKIGYICRKPESKSITGVRFYGQDNGHFFRFSISDLHEIIGYMQSEFSVR